MFEKVKWSYSDASMWNHANSLKKSSNFCVFARGRWPLLLAQKNCVQSDEITKYERQIIIHFILHDHPDWGVACSVHAYSLFMPQDIHVTFVGQCGAGWNCRRREECPVFQEDQLNLKALKILTTEWSELALKLSALRCDGVENGVCCKSYQKHRQCQGHHSFSLLKLFPLLSIDNFYHYITLIPR